MWRGEKARTPRLKAGCNSKMGSDGFGDCFIARTLGRKRSWRRERESPREDRQNRSSAAEAALVLRWFRQV
jgi:hypothetical protein